MKKRVLISIDEDLHKKVQNSFMNLSGEVEAALNKRFISADVLIPKEDGVKCEFCGKLEQKACRENDFVGLTWLCPDEVWICESCLNNKARQLVISFGTPTESSIEKRKEIMDLAKEAVNFPPIKKSILKQVKDKITGAGKPPDNPSNE